MKCYDGIQEAADIMFTNILIFFRYVFTREKNKTSVKILRLIINQHSIS